MLARTVVLAFLTTLVFSVASSASLLSDPAAGVTCTSNSADFFKQLNGYGKYGVADAASDILYNRESGSWNFGSLSGCAPLSSYTSATVTFSLAGDDNNGGVGGPAINYGADIVINGTTVESGPLVGLQHGTPYNGPFTDWVSYSFNTTDLTTPFTVGINNVAADDGWIAIDWIDVKLNSPTAVPEPSSLMLLGTGALGFFGPIRRKLLPHWKR